MNVASLMFFSALLFSLPALNAGAQESDLPKDAPVLAQVVHGVKYPLASRLAIEFAGAKFYGDRLANTWGYGLEGRYHLSEKSWLGVPIYFFQSKPVEAVKLQTGGDKGIVAFEPSIATGLIYGYNPIYGKFLLGENISHFRAGLNGGAMALKMLRVAGQGPGGDGDLDGKWIPSLTLGLQVQVQLGPKWILDIFSSSLVHQLPKVEQGDNSSYRFGWMYGARVGRTL